MPFRQDLDDAGLRTPTETMTSGRAAELSRATPSTFEAGQVLGSRYRVQAFLGRGGMGEVWRAFDLKLRVEVALKALRSDRVVSEQRIGRLRSEVRAAREVVSPNVCRIFDLVEVDGIEMVSMEYVDGHTLLEVLRERAPLEMDEARDVASQFLAGLEAIHGAGFVHRDVKPENIMVTRTGRVVVMDFGLAKSSEEGAGTVTGTPAYTAPELKWGEADARSDLFSAGMVLAEMVSPAGLRDGGARKSVWKGLRADPVQVPEHPWTRVITKAVAKDADDRYQTAPALIRALEEVAFRVHDETALEPYPGLASFEESDAEYFFGREAEVEAVWKRIQSAHLIGVIGTSGSGKSSFIGAGLIPARPEGWAVRRCTPGDAAIDSLRRLVGAEADGDHAIVQAFEDWRHQHDQALLIVDQFEELFTQNGEAEQTRCAELLGRIVLDADVRVLLAIRDDFLMRCNRFDDLQPVFSELTALDPPRGSALRRAVVQPALRCGYRFEDEQLADEILAEVEGERGELPLLAFALARLWEQRDRQNGLITRQAYLDIGGVGGALAQHAEALMERLGPRLRGIVRELFRNLVTAEGTRSSRDVDELLSVFQGNRNDAEDALRALIDARLLTSYEMPADTEGGTQHVEVIHESLITSWSRLVSWRTQDAGAARLRDDLRDAARRWDGHGRTDDRLWAGTAYREYRLWRERYPGGLTELEGAFATAMDAVATRRRRRRRMALVASLAIVAAVTTSTTWLWRRSVLNQRRAEAQKLIALGQLELRDDPTAALAYVTRSLELADTAEARLLARRTIWKGPTAFVVNVSPTGSVSFNASGTRLAQGRVDSSSFAVISRNGLQLVRDPKMRSVSARFFGSDDLFIVAGFSEDRGRFGLWSSSQGRLLAVADLAGGAEIDQIGMGIDGDPEDPRAVVAAGTGSRVTVEALYTDGRRHSLGGLRTTAPIGEGAGLCVPESAPGWLGVVEDNRVSVVTVGDDGLADRRVLGRHDGSLVHACAADPLGRFVVTFNQSSGDIKLWDVTEIRKPSTAGFSGKVNEFWLSRDGSLLWIGTSRSDGNGKDVWVWAVNDNELRFRRKLDRIEYRSGAAVDPDGRWMVVPGPDPARHRLWSLAAPVGAQPTVLYGDPGAANPVRPRFSPNSRWLATGDWSGLRLWPLVRPLPIVIPIEAGTSLIGGLKFAPDGRFLTAALGTRLLRISLEEDESRAGDTVFEHESLGLWGVEISRDGSMLAVATLNPGEVWVGRSDGTEWRRIPGVASGQVAFSPDGHRLAINPAFYEEVSTDFHVWDVTTMREVATLRLPEAEFRIGASFTPDGRLLTGTSEGIVSWDVDTGDHELLIGMDVHGFIASDDGRKLVVAPAGGRTLRQEVDESAVFFDLDTGESAVLNRHGPIWALAAVLDREGTVVVTSDDEGAIRVGPVTGEEPHLLLGHEGVVDAVAVDPRGRWIASSSVDTTIRLWPMPDVTKPPLHTLPHDELIAKLKSLTNLRAVRDEDSPTGWSIEVGPFPGWKTVPTW